MGAHSGPHGHGRIDMGALFPSGVSISTHLPSWSVDIAVEAEAESPIYVYELDATVLTACDVSYRSGGNPRPSALRIDKKAALASLFKRVAILNSGQFCGESLLGRSREMFSGSAARIRGYKIERLRPPSRVFDAPLGRSCARGPSAIPPELTRIFSPWVVLRR